MSWYYLARTHITLAALVGLLFNPLQLAADTLEGSAQPQKLNLDLPTVYTEIPQGGFKTNLNIAQQPRQASAFTGVKTQKANPLGYQQVKPDKSIRVRGWEVKDRLYMGQTRVGDDWGVGMMYTSGNFAYGVNNDSVGMVYNGEDSVYRINLEEISMEINF